MNLFKKTVTDVYVEHTWSTQWSRDKYAVWATCTTTLFGIKLMESTRIVDVFSTKQEARRYVKGMRQKHNVPPKYNKV